MNADKTVALSDYERRVHAEMLDSFDEELEMEIDDDRDAIRRAFEARGGQWRSQGCVGMQMEIVRLSHAGVSVLVDFSTGFTSSRSVVLSRAARSGSREAIGSPSQGRWTA